MHMNASRARDFASEMQDGMISPAGVKEVAPKKETNNVEDESKNDEAKKDAELLATTPADGKTAKAAPRDAEPMATTEPLATTPAEAKKVVENRRQQPLVEGSEKEAPLTQTAQSGPNNALFPTRRQLQQAVEEAKKEGKQNEEPTASPPAADGEAEDWPSEVPTGLFSQARQPPFSPCPMQAYVELVWGAPLTDVAPSYHDFFRTWQSEASSSVP